MEKLQENIEQQSDVWGKLDDSTKLKVDKIIESNETEKIRYFIIQLVEKNIWENPNITIDNYTVRIEFEWSLRENFYKIIVALLREENNYFIEKKDLYSLTSKWKINCWNFSLSFMDYTNFTIEIEVNWKITESDLKDMKQLFENNIINHIDTPKNNFNSIEVLQILNLSKNDKCVVDGNKINLSITISETTELSETQLQSILSSINSLNSKYFLKINKKHCFEKETTIEIIESSYWLESNSRHKIWLIFSNNELIINVESNPKAEKEFLENIVANLINSIKSIWEKTQTSIEILREMWMHVNENLDDDHKKTLIGLYEERWFVWYEDIKEILKINIINPWLNKEEYEAFQNKEFNNIKNIIPNSLLFEWPPWTWKTTMAEIIWQHLNFPFVYIPINQLMSKWYWESETRLSMILELVWKIWEENSWVVVLIDEIDEIWWNREKTHEATWRMTWVLLKKLDWLEKLDNILLIASTNRKNHLDPALLSRFTQEIFFRKPKEQELNSIVNYYLWIDLSGSKIFSKLLWNSGRDLKNICEDFARYFIKESLEKKDIDKKESFLKYLNLENK